MKLGMLYCKCPVCRGTKTTVQTFNEGREGELPAGSECFACCDNNGEGQPTGFVEVGMSNRQLDELVFFRDRLIVFAEEIAAGNTKPGGPDKASEWALLMTTKAMQLLAGKSALVAAASERLKANPAT